MTSSAIPRDSDYSSAIADATESAERALSEARLPIHILLTAQFGDLNDNQEEMLSAAEAALDHVAEELGSLRSLAAADCGDQQPGRQTVRVGDILQDLQLQLRDQAARAGVSLAVSIQPAMPATTGALSRLRDAIRIALMDEVRYATPGTVVRIDARTTSDGIVIAVCCGVTRSATAALLLAKRLLSTEGATLDQRDGQTVITIMLPMQGLKP